MYLLYIRVMAVSRKIVATVIFSAVFVLAGN
jgi:hypothetical protein